MGFDEAGAREPASVSTMFASMKLLTSYTLIALLAGGLLGCQTRSTSEDLRRLEFLNEEYAGDFKLAFKYPVYLEVKALGSGQVKTDEVENIFVFFFLEPHKDRTREDTNYTYLNFFDYRGEFQYQLYFNPRTKEIVKQVETAYR
jgi:hypothetical protein